MSLETCKIERCSFAIQTPPPFKASGYRQDTFTEDNVFSQYYFRPKCLYLKEKGNPSICYMVSSCIWQCCPVFLSWIQQHKPVLYIHYPVFGHYQCPNILFLLASLETLGPEILLSRVKFKDTDTHDSCFT